MDATDILRELSILREEVFSLAGVEDQLRTVERYWRQECTLSASLRDALLKAVDTHPELASDPDVAAALEQARLAEPVEW